MYHFKLIWPKEVLEVEEEEEVKDEEHSSLILEASTTLAKIKCFVHSFARIS